MSTYVPPFFMLSTVGRVCGYLFPEIVRAVIKPTKEVG